MKKVRSSLLFGCLISFTVMLTVVQTTPIQNYITTVMPIDASHADESVSRFRDPLYQQIQDLAEQFDQEPIDARVDRVWKAIPDLNGVRINVEKSYQIAKQIGKVLPDMLVIEEVEAERTLWDLEPQPIYRGNPAKPFISIMINVAWGTEHVLQLLDIFDQYQVKATFFLDGSWLSRNQEVAKEIVNREHEVGNHAYSHPDLRKMSDARIREEMLKTNQLIEELGVQPRLFAPPSGAFDQRVVNIAREEQMWTILWTLDTVDWRRPTPEAIIKRIVPNLENGALILSHPTEPTVKALPVIIEEARKQQFYVGKVSELLSPERSISIVRLQ